MKTEKRRWEYERSLPILIREGNVLATDTKGGDRVLLPLEAVNGWIFLKLLELEEGPAAVFEDFSENGAILFVGRDGAVLHCFPKRLESTKEKDEKAYYLGYQKEVAVSSNADLMGRKLLSMPGDPSYASVEPCLPPMRVNLCAGEGREAPHTFIGTRESDDVIPLYYSVKQAVSRINSGYVSTEINRSAEEHTVMEGLYGGWLPIVAMRYPVDGESYWEMTAYAKTGGQTVSVQPAWYRYIKLRGGKVEEVHYYDSYLPYPLDAEPDGEGFYRDMLLVKAYWEKKLGRGMEIDITAEPWVQDFCRHSMVLEMITRLGPHPRYGVVIRDYGSHEHDGFQDVLTASVDCYLEWGRTETAKEYMQYYFDYFVRENGQLEYRGPEMGQYGRMLAEMGQYYDFTGDPSLALACEGKLQAITDILLSRRREALSLPKDDPAYGMICGHHEADIGFVHSEYRNLDFNRPYFSNSTEAWRGLRDIGAMWEKIGGKQGNAALAARGKSLLKEAEALREDILRSLERSILTDRETRFLPPIAGTKEYYYDYPYRSMPDSFDDNRVWCEMLHSGVVPPDYVELIMKSGRVHNGMKLGIFGNRAMAVAFICYGEAYGLIQHDRIREFLLFYYAHALHMHTRGTWTAPECVDIDRDRGNSTGYCPPAQMTIPTVTKWMLVFEDPMEETLWLCKATPREWLAQGESLSVQGAPTRWGTVDISLSSSIEEGNVAGTLTLPEGAEKAVLRLRVPGGKKLCSLKINGEDTELPLEDPESLCIPREYRGSLRLEIFFR